MITFGAILAADKIIVENKSVFLCKFGEWSLMTRLAKEMDRSKVRDWAIVLGYNHDLLRRDVENVSMKCVVDQEWEKGFEHQALFILREMPPEAEGFILLPGNLPFFSKKIMNAMLEALENEKGFIIVPSAESQALAYPLFHRKFLPEVIQRLENGTFFEIVADRKSEVYMLEVDHADDLLIVNDNELYVNAKERLYRMLDDDDIHSNPQSKIPE